MSAQDATINQLLGEAEQQWVAGAAPEAIKLYDQALSLAEDAGDAETATRVLLGKGVALLQMDAAEHKVEAHSCLTRARERVAATEGTEAQLQFIDMLIEKNGLLDLPAAPEGGGCGHHDEDGAGACSHEHNELDHEELARAAVARAAAVASDRSGQEAHAAAEGGGDGGGGAAAPSGGSSENGGADGGATSTAAAAAAATARAPAAMADVWDAELQTKLVLLIADHGDAADGWADKAATLIALRPDHPRAAEEITADTVAARWAALAPQVKEEMLEREKKRDCGHTCGTCPTRQTCKLHDALGLDMEDMFGAPTKAQQAKNVGDKAEAGSGAEAGAEAGVEEGGHDNGTLETQNGNGDGANSKSGGRRAAKTMVISADAE